MMRSVVSHDVRAPRCRQKHAIFYAMHSKHTRTLLWRGSRKSGSGRSTVRRHSRTTRCGGGVASRNAKCRTASGITRGCARMTCRRFPRRPDDESRRSSRYGSPRARSGSARHSVARYAATGSCGLATIGSSSRWLEEKSGFSRYFTGGMCTNERRDDCRNRAGGPGGRFPARRTRAGWSG